MATFYNFSRLPFELRAEIWRLATESHQPREVEIYIQENTDDDEDDQNSPPAHMTSPTPAPSILHASHEARLEGMKRYERAFGSCCCCYRTPSSSSSSSSSLKHYTWVDFTVDTIYLRGNPWLVDLKMHLPESPRIRHLKFRRESYSSLFPGGGPAASSSRPEDHDDDHHRAPLNLSPPDNFQHAYIVCSSGFPERTDLSTQMRFIMMRCSSKKVSFVQESTGVVKPLRALLFGEEEAA